ncbi:sodium-independent sulfate anion transporter-like isoform X3 [Danaus plexippus]|uniref:sodium-independent sulfate anion transporter-like isoform X3 n=1 Tax=Danaus plexippus TaxID=13037 RepID=UPI002AAF1546|nr:sodium-independent sulfate anion transporter-like isoform X3 [Danaus plexippus]
MDFDDPRQPLLGCPPRSKWRRGVSRMCNVESWRRRVPITIWLPQYNLEKLLRDAIAGITVGLTSIPQGIAYAIVAGLPPQVGLYSSIFPGVMYAVFGSCKQVTVGPTAILAALLTKYVAQSEDFAYLASFLTGCVILLLGVLQLGFLLDFISKPVISGFTAAAALQISASQLKSLFNTTGSSGGTFIKAVINFFSNIKSVQLWDTLLGVLTIVSLFLLKCCSPSSPLSYCATCRVHSVRARNAVVVFAATAVAYLFYIYGMTPFKLTGKIEGGLPKFSLPPFQTVVNNNTIGFDKMLDVLGPEGLVMPLVAILESIAIAKAFAGTASVDVTQEMVAVGMCNIVSSFAQSMPATGSFTRTALNHASGVMTPAGSLFKAALVLLSVTYLSEAFRFIPRSTLAGIIMVAMVSIVDFSILPPLWRHSKSELFVWFLTVVVGVTAGLEYGIAAGAAGDALRVLYSASRPRLVTKQFKVCGVQVGAVDVALVSLPEVVCYASVEHVGRVLRTVRGHVVVLDGRTNIHADIGVIETVNSVISDAEGGKRRFLLWCVEEGHGFDGINATLVTGDDLQRIVTEHCVDNRRVSSLSGVS